MNLIYPLACSQNISSLFAIQHSWTFVFENLCIRIDSDYKYISKRLRLPNRIVVARMKKIESTIDVYPYWLLFINMCMLRELCWRFNGFDFLRIKSMNKLTYFIHLNLLALVS